MKSIYIVQYDNGQDYEDHYSCPVLAVPTKERAEQIIEEVNKWADETNEQMPALYELPVEHEDKDWDLYDASEKVRREWVETIKPPYGIGEFVTLMMERDSFYKPYLKIIEIPFEEAKA